MAIIVPIKTITPVWTGDNERKTSYLRATGLLGGLRFWTEALLRSLGEPVCSGTGNDRCIHDPGNPQGTCAACQIFGCAGLGRGFTLKVANEQPDHHGNRSEAIGKVELRYTRITSRGKKQTPEWPLNDPGLVGEFSLIFSSLRPSGGNSADAPSFGASLDRRLALALHLLLHWGMLGAKDQYGYGLVRVAGPEEQLAALWRGALARVASDHTPSISDYPSLRDFFFFSGRVNKERLPIRTKWEDYIRVVPFEIRYQVRNGLRDERDLRHYFCGAIEGNKRLATRFNMGFDGTTIYGWGHFPSAGQWANKRDRCLDLLKTKLDESCTHASWKEFDSHRDTCVSKSKWHGFLHELANYLWR